MEDLLANLSSNGFTDAKLAATYRSFSSSLVGQLLLQTATRRADSGPVEEPLDETKAQIPNQDAVTEPTDAPIASRLRPMLSEDHSTQEFEIGLETVLDRLEMDSSQ